MIKIIIIIIIITKNENENKNENVNDNLSSIDIEGIRTVFVLYFFYERYFKCKKHKQKHLSNIQPNISISKKNIQPNIFKQKASK